MGKRAQRRREARELAEHVVRNQIEPQIRAQELRERGVNADIGFVNINPDAEGFKVTCIGCGMTATLPFDPGQKVGMCPRCARERNL